MRCHVVIVFEGTKLGNACLRVRGGTVLAQKHDLLDDIIDISKGLGSLKDPLGSVSDVLAGTAAERESWNPADYKERPRVNTIPCLKCRNSKSGCTACLDACPVDAIEFDDDDEISILDTCRKCGLCVAVCPVEAFISPSISPKRLYDQIARAAASHETAYVACTRALKRVPRENEVVVACLGDIPREVWFSILTDFRNVSAYLPLGICDKCRNTTGEEMLGNAIADAEEWSGHALGLEVERDALKCKKRREFERKEFMQNLAKTTGLSVTKLNPATAAVMSVAQRLQKHAERISKLEDQLNKAVGTSTAQRRRVLKERRQLVLSALQEHPKRAKRVQLERPSCDNAACTLCGECVEACPVHACDLTGSGAFSVEPTYCLGCGLCAEVCDARALRMERVDAEDLVVVDPDAEKKAAARAAAREKSEKMKAEAKKKLDSALDRVEKLAE